MRQVLEGELLARMILHASASLHAAKQSINELNVFPVPDGDTGTNMSLTIGTAASELEKRKRGTVGDVAASTASAMLRGARGNSGVILSLLFRGVAKGLKDLETATGTDLAIAFNLGVAAAYKAVMKPVEGTVLTVSRIAAVRAEEAAQENDAIEYVLEQVISAAEAALEATLEQNPVLQKAGVVDAGGKGFVVILQGMLDELRGEPMPDYDKEEVQPAQEKVDFSGYAAEEIPFAYCTEFICSRDNAKEPAALRAFLDGLGDSLVLVEDDEMIKVHVHTNHPGRVLEEALTYGNLITVKVENMREQHTALLDAAKDEETAPLVTPAEKKYGFVAVCAGEGLADVFRELGVDHIIHGGQTMNPSTEDILRTIERTPSEVVYVLPNNKNVILAAQQCVPLAVEKQVIVLGAETVPQGMSALLAMNYDGQVEENTCAMEEAMRQVATIEITHAARDSEFDGTTIRAGDYLALLDNQLFGTDERLETLLERMAQTAAERDAEFIHIFYGEGVSEEEGQTVVEAFSKCCPAAEVTLVRGGQPVYAYLISME